MTQWLPEQRLSRFLEDICNPRLINSLLGYVTPSEFERQLMGLHQMG
jgi:hypothetical protein